MYLYVSPTGAMYPTLSIKNAEVAHYSAKSMPAEVPPRNPALAKPARILAPYLSARLRRIESSSQRDFKQPINRPTFNNVISRSWRFFLMHEVMLHRSRPRGEVGQQNVKHATYQNDP